MSKYRSDYPQEPIGDGNPYCRCARCKRSVPSINGEIEGHEEWCEWRKHVELEEKYNTLRDVLKTLTASIDNCEVHANEPATSVYYRARAEVDKLLEEK